MEHLLLGPLALSVCLGFVLFRIHGLSESGRVARPRREGPVTFGPNDLLLGATLTRTLKLREDVSQVQAEVSALRAKSAQRNVQNRNPPVM